MPLFGIEIWLRWIHCRAVVEEKARLGPTLFTERKTVQLVRTNTPLPDWAFIPAPLPPRDWTFPARLYPLLIRAREQLGKLDGIGRTLPDQELLLRPLQNREALTSSSLEGTYATPTDLLLYAERPREPTSDRDPANAQREVLNYSAALRHGCAVVQKEPLSLHLILGMHSMLMNGVRGHQAAPGQVRKHQVAVGHDRRYVPPPPQYLPDLLRDFQIAMNVPATFGDLDPLVGCYLCHYQFEAIRPFLDGNGRIGRAVLALMVFLACKHRMPWLYMSAYFERHQSEYIERLFRVSTHGEWTEWIGFCLRGTVEQAEDSISRCEELRALHRDFKKRIDADSGPRTHRIIERLFSSPVIGVANWAKTAGVAYQTAKADLRHLERHGILKVILGYTPTTYYAPDIYRVAYRDEAAAHGRSGPESTPPSAGVSEPRSA